MSTVKYSDKDKPFSIIDLEILENVSVTEFFYPAWTFTELFSSLGMNEI